LLVAVVVALAVKAVRGVVAVLTLVMIVLLLKVVVGNVQVCLQLAQALLVEVIRFQYIRVVLLKAVVWVKAQTVFVSFIVTTHNQGVLGELAALVE
jgi:hypothetical protein